MSLALTGCTSATSNETSDGETDATNPTMPTAGAGTTTGISDTDAGSDGSGPGDGSSSATTVGPPGNCNENELSEVYTRYVEPFVSGAVPSSCTECHMTGINISLYAQDTPCETMACMIDAGQVDLADPAGSTLLELIAQGNPNSTVFDIEDEHDAMLEWIEWSAKCHAEVCGEVENACKTGSGASSTGVNPIGDCSEDDLLLSFWENVIVDKGRCSLCHSEEAKEAGTFGPCPCENENQLCIDGICYAPGPYLAPSTFHGEGMLDYDDPQDRLDGLLSLYDMAALGHFDAEKPVDSMLLTKPLLEGFQPTEIYGDGISLTDIPKGVGVGIEHEGTSKFNFGCHAAPCPFEMDETVDCRTDRPCGGDVGTCDPGYACVEDARFEANFCRLEGSLCDHSYVNFLKFVTYFADCK